MEEKLKGVRLFLGRLLFFSVPLGFTGLIYAVWYFTRSRIARHISFLDAEPTIAQVGLVGVFHAIIAAWVFGKATSDRSKLYEYYALEDWVRFVLVRDDRIPWYTHWLMATFSVGLLVGAFIIRHETLVAGSYPVITTGIITSTYWLASIMADNPLHPLWWRYDNLPSIPEEYKKMTLTEAQEKMRKKVRDGEAHIYSLLPPSGCQS